jgi:hypothetical protein
MKVVEGLCEHCYEFLREGDWKRIGARMTQSGAQGMQTLPNLQNKPSRTNPTIWSIPPIPQVTMAPREERTPEIQKKSGNRREKSCVGASQHKREWFVHAVWNKRACPPPILISQIKAGIWMADSMH